MEETLDKLLFIPVINTSDKGKMQDINNAMRSALDVFNMDYEPMQIYIAPLYVSAGWLIDTPALANNYSWKDITVHGNSDFGAGLNLLFKRLTTKSGGFMEKGMRAPILLFVSAGCFAGNWQEPLGKLKSNGWFRAAVKVGVDVDGGSIKELSDVVGEENVINATKLDGELSHIITTVLKRILRAKTSAEIEDYAKAALNWTNNSKTIEPSGLLEDDDYIFG